jgi:hypothetical protein
MDACSGTQSGTQRLEEQKLLLLLWDAKLTLFTHAVNLHAKRQPVVNSQTIGARLGTKLKEKIFKAIQARCPAINKSIAAFNKCYGNYIAKFPLTSHFWTSQERLLTRNLRRYHWTVSFGTMDFTFTQRPLGRSILTFARA